MAETPHPRDGIYYGWIIVAASFVIITLAWGMMYSYAVFFKSIQAEFELSRTAVSGAASLAGFLGGAVAMFAGRFADRYGPRLTVLLTGSVFGISLILLSRINAPWQLYLVYMLAFSLGQGANYPTLIAVVSRWFTFRRGLALGIIIAGMGFGNLLLPPLSERLLSLYDWRGAYLSLGIIALVLMIGAALLLRRDPKEMGLLSEGKGTSAVPPSARSARSSSAPGFTLLQSVRTRTFWFIFSIHMGGTLCVLLVIVHLIPHITDLKPGATTMAALAQGVMGGMSIVGTIGGGMLADRIGARRVLVIALVIQSLALLWLTQARTEWMFYIFAVIFGLGYGSFAPMGPILLGSYFGVRNMGAIMGVFTLAAGTGGGAGPILAGFIFDTTQSYSIAFVLAAGIALTGACLVWLLPRQSYIPEQAREIR